MFLKDIFRILLFSMCTSFILAQEEISLFIGSQEIKENRYSNILGSPFLFEDDVPMDIVSKHGIFYGNLLGNFNGYDQSIEIRKGEKRIVLNSDQFTIVKFNYTDSLSNEILLIKGAHPYYPKKFIIQLFRGKKYTLLMEYKYKIDQKKFSNPGKTLVLREFQFIPIYYLQKDNDFAKIKLNQHSILRKIDYRKIGLDLLEKNRYNLIKENEVIKFLRDLEQALSL